jgi:hypothetical protein
MSGACLTHKSRLQVNSDGRSWCNHLNNPIWELDSEWKNADTRDYNNKYYYEPANKTEVFMAQEVEFKVGGKRYRMNRADVLTRHKKIDPGTIRAHAVEIEGVLHPIKEAFARASGIDLLDFNTNLARRVFSQLDFKVKRV